MTDNKITQTYNGIVLDEYILLFLCGVTTPTTQHAFIKLLHVGYNKMFVDDLEDAINILRRGIGLIREKEEATYDIMDYKNSIPMIYYNLKDKLKTILGIFVTDKRLVNFSIRYYDGRRISSNDLFEITMSDILLHLLISDNISVSNKRKINIYEKIIDKLEYNLTFRRGN